MKHTVMIFINVIFWMLVLAIIMTISGRMHRSVELQSNLSTALETAASHMNPERVLTGTAAADGATAVAENAADGAMEDYLITAECVEYLVTTLDTDSQIAVDVMKADARKGLLSIRVTEVFQHPGGQEGSVSSQRTVLWDRAFEAVEAEEGQQYEVRFYQSKADMLSGTDCYKIYTVHAGDCIAAPAPPMNLAHTFAGWRDRYDAMADFTQPVEQYQAYYADWN